MATDVERGLTALSAAKVEESLAARKFRQIKLAIYRRRVAAYARCFLDGDGNLTREGEIVLNDLTRLARFGVVRPDATEAELRFDQGQQRIVLHLIECMRLDAVKLARLAGQSRENIDE